MVSPPPAVVPPAPPTATQPECKPRFHTTKAFRYFLLGGAVALVAMLAGSQTPVVQEGMGDLQDYFSSLTWDLPASEALDDFLAQIAKYRVFSDNTADEQFMPALEYK